MTVPRASAAWLHTTVTAVRDLMVKRLETESLEPASKREIEMALEELDVMWEELQGQAALLERENQRYAEFFEFAPDAYLITDVGGNVREANRSALELLQVARDDVVGRGLGEFVPHDDRVSFLTRPVGALVDSPVAPIAWRSHLLTPDGASLPVEFTLRAMPLKRSGITGLCWLIRPV